MRHHGCCRRRVRTHRSGPNRIWVSLTQATARGRPVYFAIIPSTNVVFFVLSPLQAPTTGLISYTASVYCVHHLPRDASLDFFSCTDLYIPYGSIMRKRGFFPRQECNQSALFASSDWSRHVSVSHNLANCALHIFSPVCSPCYNCVRL